MVGGSPAGIRRWHGECRHSCDPRSPVQRCRVHKHRNLLAHAPERLHEEITADYTDMIYAATRQEIEARRKAFIRKWRLKHRAVADSLEEAGDPAPASPGSPFKGDAQVYFRSCGVVGAWMGQDGYRQAIGI